MIRNSIGVITLTSTVGYEALLLNKPVITLGKVFYSFHDNCTFCDSLLKLPTLLRKMRDFSGCLSDRNNRAFIAAYFDGTYPIKIQYNDPLEKNQLISVHLIIDELKKRILSKNEK